MIRSMVGSTSDRIRAAATPAQMQEADEPMPWEMGMPSYTTMAAGLAGRPSFS